MSYSWVCIQNILWFSVSNYINFHAHILIQSTNINYVASMTVHINFHMPASQLQCVFYPIVTSSLQPMRGGVHGIASFFFIFMKCNIVCTVMANCLCSHLSVAWCLFASRGTNHQNNPLVSATIIRHSSSVIFLSKLTGNLINMANIGEPTYFDVFPLTLLAANSLNKTETANAHGQLKVKMLTSAIL